jgi:hypothetical protein
MNASSEWRVANREEQKMMNAAVLTIRHSLFAIRATGGR